VELDAAVKAAVAAGRFRQPPILIGAQLSLSDDCWATAVEAAMGRQLNTWICDTYEDAALLKVGGIACGRRLCGALGVCVLWRLWGGFC
jgi:hypothetical protein